jgi:hypothetical protein
MSGQPYTPTHRLSQYFDEIEADKLSELARSQRVMDSFVEPPQERPWPVALTVGLVLGFVLAGVVLGAMHQEAIRASTPEVQFRACAAQRR